MGGGEDRAGIPRDLIKQAEIRGQDVAQIQQHQHRNDAFELRQGDVADHLSDRGPVDGRAVVKGRVDRIDVRVIQHHRIAEALPAVGQHQQPGPGGGRLIPAHGVCAESDQDRIQQTLIRGKEGKGEIAHDDPGEKVRQQRRCLGSRAKPPGTKIE